MMDTRAEVPDVTDVPVAGWRVLLAGLALAGAAMMLAEMFMVLVLRLPELLLVAAPLTVAFLLTAGVVVSLAMWRLTRGLGLRTASLLFCAAGFVAGALWGYPVFTIANNTVAAGRGMDPSSAAPLVGAIYAGSLAAFGGLAGRYFGPWAATRPKLVRMVGLTVLLVALFGFGLLSVVNLAE